jgi:putative ABC transport system permease protein
LAIVIACLGLFGLALFTTQERTKEIGIRKALGATVPGLVVLLTRRFTQLVLIAFVVAVPVTYLLMKQWLENFAYHVEIGVGVFLGAGVLSLLIAFLTVSYHAVTTARANPVKALRYE